jgi:hypothetical protein
MNLKEYLTKHKISNVQIARELDFHPYFICGVITGSKKCGKKTARVLSRYTHGLVTEEEILSVYEKRQAEKKPQTLKPEASMI